MFFRGYRLANSVVSSVVALAWHRSVYASPSIPEPAPTSSPLQGPFFSLGIGELDPAFAEDSGSSIFVATGQPLNIGVHLVESVVVRTGTPSGQTSSSTAVSSRDDIGVYVGLEWVPFRSEVSRPAFVPISFGARCAVGILGQSIIKYSAEGQSEAIKFGPSASAEVAWMPFQGVDYSVGFAVHLRSSYVRHSRETLSTLMLVIRLKY